MYFFVIIILKHKLQFTIASSHSIVSLVSYYTATISATTNTSTTTTVNWWQLVTESPR